MTKRFCDSATGVISDGPGRLRTLNLVLRSALRFNLTTCGGQRLFCAAPGPAFSSAAVLPQPAPAPCFLWPGCCSLAADASPEHKPEMV